MEKIDQAVAELIESVKGLAPEVGDAVLRGTSADLYAQLMGLCLIAVAGVVLLVAGLTLLRATIRSHNVNSDDWDFLGWCTFFTTGPALILLLTTFFNMSKFVYLYNIAGDPVAHLALQAVKKAVGE